MPRHAVVGRRARHCGAMHPDVLGLVADTLADVCADCCRSFVGDDTHNEVEGSMKTATLHAKNMSLPTACGPWTPAVVARTWTTPWNVADSGDVIISVTIPKEQ